MPTNPTWEDVVDAPTWDDVAGNEAEPSMFQPDVNLLTGTPPDVTNPLTGQISMGEGLPEGMTAAYNKAQRDRQTREEFDARGGQPTAPVEEEDLYKSIPNALLQAAQRSTGHALSGLSQLASSLSPGTISDIEPNAQVEASWQKRAAMTPAQRREYDLSQPLSIAGRALSQTAEESHPVQRLSGEAQDYSEKAYNATLATSEAAGGFFPAVAAGPGAPVVFALQTAGQELTSGFDQLVASGRSPDEAADISASRALENGTLQGILFELLPARLKAGGDAALNKLAYDGARDMTLARLAAGRVAQGAEGAAFGAASQVGSNVVDERPWYEGLGSAAAGMGLIQALMPRGMTKEEVKTYNEKSVAMLMNERNIQFNKERNAVREAMKQAGIDQPLNQAEIKELTSLRMKAPADLTPLERDRLTELDAIHSQDETLAPEFRKVLEDAAQGTDSKVEVINHPDESWLARWNAAKKTTEINAAAMSRQLTMLPEGKRKGYLESTIGEEGIHEYTSPEDRIRFLKYSTARERKLAVQRYFGNSEGVSAVTGKGLTDHQLADEMIRMQVQRMMGMTPTEIAMSVGRSREAAQAVVAIENLVRGARKLWNKAVYYEGGPINQQQAVLDAVFDKIQKAKKESAPAPREDMPFSSVRESHVTEADVEKMSPEEKSKLKHNDGIAYGLTLDQSDVPRLQKKYDAAQKRMSDVYADGYDESPEKANASAEAFADSIFYGGALMGATRGKHPISGSNYDLFMKQQASLPASGVRGGMSKKAREIAEQHRRIVELQAKARGEELPEELRTKPVEPQFAPVPPEERVGLEAGGVNRPTPAQVTAKANEVLQSEINHPTGVRPSFEAFTKAFEGWAEPARLRDAWHDAVWSNLLKAEPDRLSALRKSLGLERNYGTRPIAALVGKEGFVPDIPAHKPSGETTAKEASEAAKKYKQSVQISIRDQKLTAESKQRYRSKIVSAIARKLITESIEGRPELNRKEVGIDDVAFSNEKSKFGAYHEITREDMADPQRLNAILRDEWRGSSVDPETASRRVVAVVDSRGRVSLLSTYNDAGVQRVTEPAGSITGHKPFRELNKTFLNQYRPFASILLNDPIRGLRQKFETVGEFMDKIGEEAKNRSEINELGHTPEGPAPEDFEAEGTPGLEGEGGMFMGPSKGAAPAESRRPVLKSKVPLTLGEATAVLNHIISKTEHGKVESPSDVRTALRELVIKAGKKTLASRDLTAVNAYRKIFKGLERDNPNASVEELTDEIVQRVTSAAITAKDSNAFARAMVSEFGGRTAQPLPVRNSPRIGVTRDLAKRGDIRPPTSQNLFQGPFQRAEAPRAEIGARTPGAYIPEGITGGPTQTETIGGPPESAYAPRGEQKETLERYKATAKKSGKVAGMEQAMKMRERIYRNRGKLLSKSDAAKLVGYEGPMSSVRSTDLSVEKRKSNLEVLKDLIVGPLISAHSNNTHAIEGLDFDMVSKIIGFKPRAKTKTPGSMMGSHDEKALLDAVESGQKPIAVFDEKPSYIPEGLEVVDFGSNESHIGRFGVIKKGNMDAATNLQVAMSSYSDYPEKVGRALGFTREEREDFVRRSQMLANHMDGNGNLIIPDDFVPPRPESKAQMKLWGEMAIQQGKYVIEFSKNKEGRNVPIARHVIGKDEVEFLKDESPMSAVRRPDYGHAPNDWSEFQKTVNDGVKFINSLKGGPELKWEIGTLNRYIDMDKDKGFTWSKNKAVAKAIGEIQKNLARLLENDSKEQSFPASSVRGKAEKLAREAWEYAKSPAVMHPEAIIPDTTNPIPRIIDNVDSQLTRAMGIERIPLIGRLWGPRGKIRDAVDRAIIGYSVKRNIGNSQAALIGKRLNARLEELGEPFAQDKEGKITNVNADKGQSTYPADLFEDWQRQQIVPEKMRKMKEVDYHGIERRVFNDTEIQRYVEKHPETFALGKNQEAFFREMLTYLEDAYQYLDEKNSKLDYYGGESMETRRDQAKLLGLPSGIELRPFPRVALFKRSVGPVRSEISRRIGGSYGVEKERLYRTEAQGQKTVGYEPDMVKRMVAFVQRTYKAVADADLANNPVLRGKKPEDRIQDLAKEYKDELMGGEMTQRDIIEMANRARLGTEGEVHGHGAFANKIYPAEVAAKLNRSFGEQKHHIVNALAEASTMVKAFMLTGDLAQYFQQGAPMIFRHPGMWATATTKSLKSIMDPNVTGRYLLNPDNYKAATEFAQAGGSLGHLQDFMSGSQPGEVATRIPGVRQVVTRSGQAFGTFFDIAKIEMWKALRETTPKAEWGKVVETIDNIVLSGKMESAGLSPGRSTGERIALMAAAYYRGAIQLVAGMAEKGVAGKEARRTLGSYALGLVSTMTGLYVASGMSWDEIKKRLTPGLNNNKFLAYPIKTGNTTQEVGPGGIVLNMVSLGTDMAMNANDPKTVADISMKWLTQKFGPALSTAEAVRTGHDSFGKPVSRAWAVGRNFLPIAAQRVIAGSGSANKPAEAISSAASFIGLNSRTTTPINDVYELANKFLKDSGLRKETGWEMTPVDEASYTKLRSAATSGSQSDFNSAYNDLLKTHTTGEIFEDMEKWFERGFAGTEANEHKFRASLNDYEMGLYRDAQEMKRDIFRSFREMRLDVP